MVQASTTGQTGIISQGGPVAPSGSSSPAITGTTGSTKEVYLAVANPFVPDYSNLWKSPLVMPEESEWQRMIRRITGIRL